MKKMNVEEFSHLVKAKNQLKWRKIKKEEIKNKQERRVDIIEIMNEMNEEEAIEKEELHYNNVKIETIRRITKFSKCYDNSTDINTLKNCTTYGDSSV